MAITGFDEGSFGGWKCSVSWLYQSQCLGPDTVITYIYKMLALGKMGEDCRGPLGTISSFFNFEFISYKRCQITFIFFKEREKAFFFLNFTFLLAPGLGCIMWDLVPWAGIKPRPPALGAQSLSYWTTREVPLICIFFPRDLQTANMLSQRLNYKYKQRVKSKGDCLGSVWAWPGGEGEDSINKEGDLWPSRSVLQGNAWLGKGCCMG